METPLLDAVSVLLHLAALIVAVMGAHRRYQLQHWRLAHIECVIAGCAALFIGAKLTMMATGVGVLIPQLAAAGFSIANVIVGALLLGAAIALRRGWV